MRIQPAEHPLGVHTGCLRPSLVVSVGLQRATRRRLNGYGVRDRGALESAVAVVRAMLDGRRHLRDGRRLCVPHRREPTVC